MSDNVKKIYVVVQECYGVWAGEIGASKVVSASFDRETILKEYEKIVNEEKRYAIENNWVVDNSGTTDEETYIYSSQCDYDNGYESERIYIDMVKVVE